MIAFIALWTLVLFETGLLLLLLRALGQLRQQGTVSASRQEISPFAERGLALGSPAPDFVVKDYQGRSIRLKDSQGRWRILAFISPGCPACEGTIQTLNGVGEDRPDLVVLLIGGAARAANEAYAHEQGATVPILTPEPGLAKEVFLVQGVPFVYILDKAALIRAKGVVNGPEHLQQLLANTNAPEALSHLRSYVDQR